MEPWETELREKLNKELKDGPYEIEAGGLVIITGKGGYIDFQVRLRKQFDNPPVKIDSPITNQMLDDLAKVIFQIPKTTATIYSDNQKKGSNRIKPKKR